ncbi:hypothetical protein SAMN05192561_10236 [Halopenitus malekzadehii]|uniref:Uncharacterized protein n=1 Tax=Halopenitus malekzadehii TaxID=1267564 RepID=A0A1H6IGZ0_9EURY|nr:hypothetical protein SAMN05192561_10236 [Halopenitus malekzadehii]
MRLMSPVVAIRLYQITEDFSPAYWQKFDECDC